MMAPIRYVVLILAGLALASPADAQRPMVRDTLVPRFAEHIDHLAAAVGLQPLRTDSEWHADRELRMWIGFGFLEPQRLVRLMATEAGVTGQYLLWWFPEDPASASAGNQDSTRGSSAEFYAWIRRTFDCGAHKRGRRHEYCEVSVPDSAWTRVLHRLDSLGVMHLPDETALEPPLRPGEDGMTLVVEARTRERYRTYSYWMPRPAATQPEARSASEMLATLLRIVGHGR